jgi:hypothetical protein
MFRNPGEHARANFGFTHGTPKRNQEKWNRGGEV